VGQDFLAGATVRALDSFTAVPQSDGRVLVWSSGREVTAVPIDRVLAAHGLVGARWERAKVSESYRWISVSSWDGGDPVLNFRKRGLLTFGVGPGVFVITFVLGVFGRHYASKLREIADASS
jgi:hypothetical protein